MGPRDPLASNNDPIFWVTHAVWGRFWHYIRLAPESVPQLLHCYCNDN